jgi:hypothetical protein
MSKKRNLAIRYLITTLLLVNAGLGQAATITVGPKSNYDCGSIQAGIDAAANGDIVLVTPGEYVITEPITFRGKTIIVRSEGGSEQTIIRMDVPADAKRGSVVIFENGETNESILEGFTITGGTGSWVSTVSVYAGGGVYFNASSGTLRKCEIVENRVDVGGGGGVSACFGSSPILTDCVFTENLATYGGGVHCWNGSSPVLTNCIITENSAVDSGGGVWCQQNSSTTITDCIIMDNSATSSGGGVSCFENASMIMSYCEISENSAADHGAGVSCWDSSSVTLSNCTIAKNTASKQDAGIFCGLNSSGNITNCTIVENSAGVECGAIECWGSSTMMVTNCIIWGNTSPRGHEIYVLNSGTLHLTYSNIFGGKVVAFAESGSTLNWDEGNIEADPLFVRLGYLDDKGTRDPSDDVWVEGDYHLKSQAGRWDADSQIWVQDGVTSPCIDAGDPMSPIGWELFPNGGFVNMGAYGGMSEASKTYFGEPVCETIVAGDINGDGQVNRADLEIMALHWTDDVPLPVP